MTRPVSKPVLIEEVFIDPEVCSACGLCRAQCPVQAISFDRGLFRIGSACLNCAACAELCPTGAISLKRIVDEY